MGATITPANPPDEETTDVRVTFRRMVRYAKPYVGTVVMAMICALVFSSARYGRAYLMKPLLDDVMLPYQSVSSSTIDWLPGFDDLAEIKTAADTAVPKKSDDASKPSEATPDSEAKRAEVLAQVSRSFRWVMIAAIAIIIAMPIAHFGRAYLIAYVLGRIGLDMQEQLASKLLTLSLSFHRTTRSGDTLTRALQDADNSQKSLGFLLSDLLPAFIMIVIGGGTLLYISWQLTLIALLVVPVIVGVMVFFGGKIQDKSRRRQVQLGEVTQRLLSILSGIKVIKAFRGEKVEEQAFHTEARTLFRRNMKVVKHRVISTSLVEVLNSGVAVAMIILGTILVLRSQWGLSGGDIAAFALALGTIYRPIKTVSRNWAQMADSLVSAERFLVLLDTPGETPDVPNAVEIDGVHDSIRVENVSFSYGREAVLAGVSLEAKPGQLIAVVGRTGGGKTTLMDLLLRFQDPDEGSIYIDGVDLRNITRESLLDQIAVVTQEPFLFDTTIFENIQYGRPQASRAEVIAAAASAHVDEFVDELTFGYETEVGEFGLQLSGGQRQRITIARALLKDPAILICDEATSSLDAKTERTVQEAIESLRKNRTIFIVAHRLSTIRGADQIVVIDKGTVARTGSHEELMADGGIYEELVRLQLEGHEAPLTGPALS